MFGEVCFVGLKFTRVRGYGMEMMFREVRQFGRGEVNEWLHWSENVWRFLEDPGF